MMRKLRKKKKIMAKVANQLTSSVSLNNLTIMRRTRTKMRLRTALTRFRRFQMLLKLKFSQAMRHLISKIAFSMLHPCSGRNRTLTWERSQLIAVRLSLMGIRSSKKYTRSMCQSLKPKIMTIFGKWLRMMTSVSSGVCIR